MFQELDLSYSPHSITPGPDTGRSAMILLPNLKSLNLTCSLVLNHTMCDEGLYQYESPLDPKLLLPMVQLEVSSTSPPPSSSYSFPWSS